MPARRPQPHTRSQPDETDGVAVELPEEEALRVLEKGEITGVERIPWGSNYTFLAQIEAGRGRYLRAVYKPRDGESPLYDFQGGALYMREYAAYLLSRSLGWPPIPTTLVRDGPYGVGSVQQFVRSEPEVTYFDLVGENAEELLRFALFDVLANNADRKAGHCLLGTDGKIWSIDHGLTFHHLFKLRSVMLEFWGARIPPPLLRDMESLALELESGAGLVAELAGLLAEREIDALRRRVDAVLRDPVIPKLDPYRNVPWPLV